MALTILILAAGQSSRMGQDKSQLQRPDGLTQLAFTLDLARSLSPSQVFISSRDTKTQTATTTIKDELEDKGPLGGIHACLRHVDDFDRLLIIPCDMPELDVSDLNALLHSGASAAHYSQYPLPCLLTVTPDLRRHINHQILAQGGGLSIRHLLHAAQAQEQVPAEPGHLISTNTPDEWQAFVTRFTPSEDTPHG